MLGGVADEFDASTDSLGDLNFALPCFAEVEWLAWNAAVIKQRHDLYLLAFWCLVVNVFHKLLLEFD